MFKTMKEQEKDQLDNTEPLRPYQCPVCHGTGIVPGGFYDSISKAWTSSIMSEQCRACGGTGVLWG